jgi:hypothetical protein
LKINKRIVVLVILVFISMVLSLFYLSYTASKGVEYIKTNGLNSVIENIMEGEKIEN